MDRKDNFYDAINHDWLLNKSLEKNQTHIDNFLECTEKVEHYLYNGINDLLKKQTIPVEYGLENFLIFYHQASNFKKREQLGIEPLVKILERYTSLESFDDYIFKLPEFEESGLPSLLPFHVAPDLLDSSKYVIWVKIPELTFPDSSYYDKQGKEILNIWKNYQKELMKEVGFSDNESENILNKVIELDKLIVNYLSKDTSNLMDHYNLYSFTDFQKLIPKLPLEKFFNKILGRIPKTFILSEECFWKEFASVLYSDKLWEHIKAKLIYGVISMYSSCLTSKIHKLSTKFRNMLLNISSEEYDKQTAYNLTQFALGSDLSYWYSKTNISEEDKAFINKLVSIIIKEYKKQISNSARITSIGRKKIIEKLDNLVVQIGGPVERLDGEIKLSIDDSLVDNVNHILSNSSRIKWNNLDNSVERNGWSTNSFTVDAYYYAQMNKIVLPAGILQKPFYSRNYSFIKNLSRIGFLIAHEISHAFDSEGSSFNKYGNYEKWLPDKDINYFEQLSVQIKRKYEGQQISECFIDGDLTLSENIADLAGFSCIEEIVLNNYSEELGNFYDSFTKLWRSIERKEYLQMITLTDPHIPNKLRVNNLLSNSEHFIKLYNICKSDGMWIEPEERIKIF